MRQAARRGAEAVPSLRTFLLLSMANIPVERKSGLPPWAWIAGLLGLLLLGALLLSQCNNEDDATGDTAVVVDDGEVSTAGEFDEDLAAGSGAGTDAAANGAVGSTTGAATGAAFTTIDDLNTSLDDTAAGAGSLNGRAVTLTDVPVTSVVGDSTFYVGTGQGRVLVVLNELGESETGAGGTDGRYDVDEGDVVSLRGRLTSYAPTVRGLSTLSAADRAEVERRRYVIVTEQGGLSGADVNR